MWFTDPYCSDAEIEHFRKLIYASQYLKDGGRVRNGKIDCTAMLGRVSGAGARLGQGVARADGTRFYRDIEMFRISGQMAPAVEKGNALIVYSPFQPEEVPIELDALHVVVRYQPYGDSKLTRGYKVNCRRQRMRF